MLNLLSGREIQFRDAGKSFSYSANPDKLRLFAALHEVIKHGEIKNSKPPKEPEVELSTKAYHWLEAKVRLGNEIVTVGVTLREDTNGNLYYNHNPIGGKGEAPVPKLSTPPYKGGAGNETGASNTKRSRVSGDVNLDVQGSPLGLDRPNAARVSFEGEAAEAGSALAKRKKPVSMPEVMAALAKVIEAVGGKAKGMFRKGFTTRKFGGALGHYELDTQVTR